MLLSVEPPKELDPGEQLGLLTHDISSEEPVVLKLRWIFLVPLLGLPEGRSSSQPWEGALLHPHFPDGLCAGSWEESSQGPGAALSAEPARRGATEQAHGPPNLVHCPSPIPAPRLSRAQLWKRNPAGK